MSNFVKRVVIVREDGRFFQARQGRYTYATFEEAKKVAGKFSEPLRLELELWWCYSGHFDPFKPVAKNVRFWEWINDGWVKLTLRPGDCLCHFRHSLDDEGWTQRLCEWEYEEDGSTVEYKWSWRGRDCDGMHSGGGEFVAIADDIYIDQDGLRRLNWQELEAYQRDHTAEAAGY